MDSHEQATQNFSLTAMLSEFSSKGGGFGMKTIKWIIMVVLAVGIGTFVSLNILGKIDMNVWLTRGIGCLITVISAIIVYHCFSGRKNRGENKQYEKKGGN